MAFDRCPQCGRYVSSAMFNINAERCLDCAPWENEYPVFCHHCGIRLKDPDAFFCPACGRGNGAYRTDCISCGAALPKETLYDFYRARHRCCPGCGVVVTDVAVYCPECGTRLSKETGAKGASG